jgi:hypothetical protein
MTFTGKWVWEMKDYIDVGFMRLFYPTYLFKDYETKGLIEPDDKEEKNQSEKLAFKEKSDAIK